LVRADGKGTQVTYHGWPFYHYIRDQKPGDVIGQYGSRYTLIPQGTIPVGGTNVAPDSGEPGAVMPGETGAAGSKGNKGDKGDSGAAGADGADGAAGPAGSAGSAGTAAESGGGGSGLAIFALILAIVAIAAAGRSIMMGRKSSE